MYRYGFGWVVFAVTALGIYACNAETGTNGSTTSTLGAGGASGPGSSSSSMGGGDSDGGDVSSGTGMTPAKTCRGSCSNDDDCCPAGSQPGACGITKKYPNNIYCDTDNFCRVAPCSSTTSCLTALGYSCIPINGSGQCWRQCSEGGPVCPSGQSCTGTDDNNNGYCREASACDSTTCSGTCMKDVCVCTTDDQCSATPGDKCRQ